MYIHTLYYIISKNNIYIYNSVGVPSLYIYNRESERGGGGLPYNTRGNLKCNLGQ